MPGKSERTSLSMLHLKNLIESPAVEMPGQYEIEVTIVGTAPTCGCATPNLRKNGRRKSMFFDTPMHGKKVGIWVQRQRYQCTGCNRTIYETIPHMSREHDMTERLVDYIKTNGTERTFTAIAGEIGVDVQTVRGIWRRHAEKELNRLEPVTPVWMGIDELHIMHAYRGVITNVKERTIVDLLEDRRKETVIRYLAGLPDREKITHVAMDMWEPYRDAVRAVLPKAVIVVDRFHISRMGSEALERIRKEVRVSLPTKGRLQLMGDRWLLLRNEKDLNATQSILLQSTLGQFPLLAKGWKAKEQFRAIWNNKTRQDGEDAYNQWLRDLDPEIAPAFGDLTKAMGNWHAEIFNYFQHRITNAYTESFNSIARKMDRMGRGYSFKVLRAKLLLKHSCHKKTPPPAKFSRGTDRDAAYRSLLDRKVAEIQLALGPDNLGVDISTLAKWLDSMPEKS